MFSGSIGVQAGSFLIIQNSGSCFLSVSSELAQGAAEEWWRRFLADVRIGRPPPAVCTAALRLARGRAGGQPAALVVTLLRLFPEVTEAEFDEWMKHTGFLWEAGDHEQMAVILVERRWETVARSFRWSWKRELTLVAWYARDLLSWPNRFWSPPKGADLSAWENPNNVLEKNMKVLFLAANPMSLSTLGLGEEARAIEEKVRDAKHRDLVDFRTRWAVRPEDLQQALLEVQPTVVHFAGHGGGAVGIVLNSADPTDRNLVGADALTDLFRVLKDGIRVVVLNACYSEVQAQAIVKEIDYVVGMSDSVGDDSAIAFSAAFYRGLAFGKSVRTAFELGINQLKLSGLPGDAIPQLLVRSGADASTVLVAGPPS